MPIFNCEEMFMDIFYLLAVKMKGWALSMRKIKIKIGKRKTKVVVKKRNIEIKISFGVGSVIILAIIYKLVTNILVAICG